MATVTCPAGHESTTEDYCDTCGAPIGAATAPGAGDESGAAAGAEGTAGGEAEASAAPEQATCPGCGEPVLGRFCESCGYDVEQGRPAAPPPVSLQLGADRAHWERMVGEGEPEFPAAVPALSFELAGDRLVLGRVRAGAEVDVDLALTGSAADPAVSHRQCEFVRDGTSWTVRDLDSANGTWINDADEPLADGATHTLVPGDRILLGAWTCLTVQGASSAAADPPAEAPAQS
jgi:FHA domain